LFKICISAAAAAVLNRQAAGANMRGGITVASITDEIGALRFFHPGPSTTSLPSEPFRHGAWPVQGEQA
jgi:hypothetical protein